MNKNFDFFSQQDSWYYDDEMMEMDGYDEPDPDSDFDYEDHYRGRRKKKGGKPGGRGRGGRQSAVSSPKGDPEIPGSGGRGGRGRKRALLYDMDNDKPFACECKYKKKFFFSILKIGGVKLSR